MIIATRETLTIGKQYKGFTDAERANHPEQPFVVLHDAGFHDWLRQCVDHGVDVSGLEYLRASTDRKFYEVATD